MSLDKKTGISGEFVELTVLAPLEVLFKKSTTADKAKSEALASKNPMFSPKATSSATETFRACIEAVQAALNSSPSPEAETTSPTFP